MTNLDGFWPRHKSHFLSSFIILILLMVNKVEAAEALEVIAVMDNITYKFVYAFFGKDALLWVISDPESANLIAKATAGELSRYSAPFNSKVFVIFMLPLLKMVYYITIAYMIIRTAAFAMEHFWIAHSDGKLPMGTGEFRAFSLKYIVIGGLVVIPLQIDNSSPVYSIQQSIGIRLFGSSVDFSDDALNAIVDSQTQAVVTTKIPRSDTKINTTKAVLEFFVCLNSTEEQEQSRSQVVINFEDDHEKMVFRATVNAEQCNLEVKMGMDTESDSLIKSVQALTKEQFLDDSSFIQAQYEIFTKMVNLLVTKGEYYSRTLSLPIEPTVIPVTANDKKKQYAMDVWSKNSLTKKLLVNWELTCTDFYKWQFPNSRITDKDRALYFYNASRCLSYDISKLVLLPSSGEVVEILNDKNDRGRELPVCMNSVLRNENKTPTYDSSYRLQGAQDNAHDIADKITIEHCVKEMCANSELANGNLYLCTRSMAIFEELLRNESMKSKGAMGLGAYMFSMFTPPQLSEIAKLIFNGVSASTSETAFDHNKDKTYKKQQIVLPLGSQLSKSSDGQIVRQFLSIYDNTAPYVSEFLPSNVNGEFDFFNLIGVDRLMTCTQNPLTITDGYVCTNAVQELNFFGRLLMNLAVDITYYKSLLEFKGAAQKLANASKGGSVGLPMTDIINKAMSLILPAINAAQIMGYFRDLTGGSDSFGYLTKEDYNLMLMSDNLVSGLLYFTSLDPDSTISTLFNTALLTTFLVGVFCAVILPLVPVIMFLYALGRTVFLMIKLLSITGIKLVDSIFEEKADFFCETMQRIWADILAMVLKLPLTMIGVVLAWMLTNTMISNISKTLTLDGLYRSSGGASVTGLTDAIIVLVVTLIVMMLVYNLVLSMIEAFYDFTVDWLLGNLTQDPFSENSVLQWRDAKQSFHGFMNKSGGTGAGGV
ncbi:MAG: hypothetical protein HAW67_02505 [Endozoicomonadaceae bacterium]|nr:hypothetical protein [Endozoicomonadaceae bacterium]